MFKFFLTSAVFTVLVFLASNSVLAQNGNEWNRSIQGNSAQWVSGPYIEAGVSVTVLASGKVCCQASGGKNDWEVWKEEDHKCRNASTSHAEGALLITISGYGTFKYSEGLTFTMPNSGRLSFIVEDTRYDDNFGSYDVRVSW